MMQLSQVSHAVDGQLSGPDGIVQGISINTREDCSNRLFVALKGDNFDAHNFLGQAVEAGASAALIEQPVETQVPSILVKDSHQALAAMAAWWRAQFVIPLVGVTGSAGKTTVKEMLGSIFAQLGEGVVTKGNLNNEIGVPLTLMRLSEHDRYAVVEMGMNHSGEISRITQVAKPTIALINNAGAAHLEGLGSLDAVAAAKGEIFEGLTADGVAIINADDKYADAWIKLAGARKKILFGLTSAADVTADYTLKADAIVIKVRIDGKSSKIKLNTLGEHNVRNALAAIAAAHAANIPLAKIKRGLENYRPIAGRLNTMQVGEVCLIDDSYNANPASMRAAIAVLAQFESTTLIVGDMGELGAATQEAHLQLGAEAAQAGIQNVWACGEYAALVREGFTVNGSSESVQAFDTQEQLIAFALANLPVGAVLVKGSRSAKMERVVVVLKEKFTIDNASAKRNGDH